MYNSRGYDDRRRGGPYNESNRGRGDRNDYGRRDDYGGGGMKRSSYSDHRGIDSQGGSIFSSSAPKRSRDLDSLGGGYMDRGRGSAGGGILDTPRLDRSLLLAEEERIRQLEEIAQLKREHELALLRRTFDLNRREVQAALSSRDAGYRSGGGPGGYGPRDRQMDYDRRGIHDRDTRRDRLRREAPRGPRPRSPPPPRRRSPIQNRLGPPRAPQSRSPRGSRSRDRYSRNRDQNRTPAPVNLQTSRNRKRCEICGVDFKLSEDKIKHEEEDEKHLSVMKQFRNFSEKSGKSMDELIKQYLDSRSKPEPGEVPAETESKDQPTTSKENVDADKYPGLFYTGERWRVRVYNPDLIMGTDFIVPATGWYCVLCQKFYYSEGPAKSTHCQTEDHWENLRSWLKINGHRYEPYQYDKFVESEEKAKEELQRKRNEGVANVAENEVTKQSANEVAGVQSNQSSAITSDDVTAVEANSSEDQSLPQQSEIELDEGEINSTECVQKKMIVEEETDDVALDYECEEEEEDQYIQEDDIQVHEGGQIDDIDVEEGEMRSGRESANNNPDTETVHSEEEQAMKSPPARRIQQEREKSSQLKYRKNSSPIPNMTSSKVSSSGDAEMYSMFDNIEAILNNGGGVDGKDDNHHEIPVSVVDDPFGAEGSEYCNELTYDDDLHDPPTEEISGEHVTAYEFDETTAMEEGAIEGIPPINEIEEEQTFTVHEEEEEEELEEEDGEEKTGVDTVANASSSSEHSHQLSIREEPVSAGRPRRVSPLKRGNTTPQTAKRGSPRGRPRNK